MGDTSPSSLRSRPKPYPLTVKFLELLTPLAVATRTLTRPKAALFGTLHVMVVALHDV
jgi:hypothetical protein